MEATIGWTEGKPWEWESSVGKERHGSDDKVNGRDRNRGK